MPRSAIWSWPCSVVYTTHDLHLLDKTRSASGANAVCEFMLTCVCRDLACRLPMKHPLLDSGSPQVGVILTGWSFSYFIQADCRKVVGNGPCADSRKTYSSAETCFKSLPSSWSAACFLLTEAVTPGLSSPLRRFS